MHPYRSHARHEYTARAEVAVCHWFNPKQSRAAAVRAFLTGIKGLDVV